MNTPEKIETGARLEQPLDERESEPVTKLVEIEAGRLAEVAGGPDGTAVGYS